MHTQLLQLFPFLFISIILAGCNADSYQGEISEVVMETNETEKIDYIIVETNEPIQGSETVRLHINSNTHDSTVISNLKKGTRIRFEVGDAIAEPAIPQTTPPVIEIISE